VPKPPLRRPYDTLAGDIIETLIAGHKRYRPDLPYPESHSDMQGAVEALLMMFEVKRRPVAIPLADLRVAQCTECGADVQRPGKCDVCRSKPTT
jgi:hypothetical protein